MTRKFAAVLAGFGILLSAAASAHVALSSGPGFAGTTQEVTLSIGHGCSNLDTYSLRTEIPAGVTSVRPMTSNFGKTSVEKNGAGDVTAVTWQKADADLTESDTQFYKVTVRLKVPDQPFTILYLPTRQICKGTDGGTLQSDWTSTTSTGGGENEEPAPSMVVLPARTVGWNKYTIPRELTDLKTFFGDAQIVWKGTAAYSNNPQTAAMIGSTEGVSALTSLQAGDEVWVKY